MIDQRILLVEDEETTRTLIRTMLTAGGYVVVECSDGRKALEEYTANPFPVVITDIDMPVMDGNEMISRIKTIDENQVIIVMTVHSEPEMIIDIMKKGVFDYSIKPTQAGDLLYKVERAFDVAGLKRLKKTMEREKIVKLENQLEWFNWNETFVKRDYDRVEQTLFHSLHTSFNQGAGFGALLTLTSMIAGNAEQVDGKYCIDAGLFDLIRRNALIAEKTLNVFSDINWISSNELNKVRMNLSDLHSILAEVIGESASYLVFKKQVIILSDKKSGFDDIFVMADRLYIKKAVSELVLNGCKFSDAGSDIYLIVDSPEQGSVAISIVSKPFRNDRGFTGIPFEYENLVFEPFFRLTNTTFEEFNSLDYGLGLTTVEKIVLKHGGNISVSNIIDYSNIQSGPVTKVNFTVKIPRA